jgi:peptidoglycan/xylan/chitin deacetylase (PgdA/CDA1 family)
MRSLLLLVLAAPVLAAPPQFGILSYHEVEPVPHLEWSVSREDFAEQMIYLAATGYHVVPIEDVFELLAGKRKSLPRDPVVITVYDGWESAFSEIAPLLKQLRMPWSLYIYPGIIDVGLRALKWPELLQLAASGVDIESHTLSHPHLIRKAHPEMTDAAYAAWLHNELAGSRAVIEQRIGKHVRFLAYPYGDWDAGVEQEAARDGYALALTEWRGVNTPQQPPLELKRLPILRDTNFAQFMQDLGAEPLELGEESPVPDSVAGTTRISAVIAGPSRVKPASVHIVLLGGEGGASKYDPRTGRITLTLKATAVTEHERVVVWAERLADGHRAAATWSFFTTIEAKKKSQPGR